MATLEEMSKPRIETELVTIPGKWVEFSLGIFLLSTPTRTLENGNIIRNVEAYDGTLILKENLIDDRQALAAGQSYYDYVISGLQANNITKFNIERSDKTASVAVEWEPGTAWLTIINDCLSALNYTPITVDEYGFFTSQLYRSPTERPAEVEYTTGQYSVTYDGIEEELDTMSVANRFTVVLNDPERDSLRAVVTNENPDSPTSYQSRGGRWITDFRTVDDIADQEALNAYAERIAFEASQVYGHISFDTAAMPIHGYANVLQFENEELDIHGNFSETKWELPLQVGATMQHEARRVVDISGGTKA